MAKKPTKVEEELEELEEVDDLEEVEDDSDDDSDEDDGNIISAKEAARLIGTDGRTLRKFLRHRHGLVGQGNRWEISVEELDELKKAFNKWHKPRVKEAKAPKKVKSVTFNMADDDDADDDDVLDEIEDLDEEIDA